MELQNRTGFKKFVNGLARCMESYFAAASRYSTEALEWRRAKETGKRLFAPELGGSYAVFNARPMSQAIIDYCVQDVTLLPRLYDEYAGVVSIRWRAKLEREAARRVAVCLQQSYMPHGRHKALAPAFA